MLCQTLLMTRNMYVKDNWKCSIARKHMAGRRGAEGKFNYSFLIWEIFSLPTSV